MINIEGIEIQKSPLKLDWVGDLLFFDWSLIGVYKDEVDTPYIKAWLDNHEMINRYVIFEVNVHLLEKYIFGKLPYADMISNPNKDLMFVVEYGLEETVQSCKVISANSFPTDYLPQKDVCFDDHEALELDSIIHTFKLKNFGILIKIMPLIFFSRLKKTKRN